MRRPLPYAVLLATCVLLGAVTADESRPSIIFFLSDDHRADFLSCAGHPIVKTPSIDSLAERGIRFKNAFVTTSICAASRATLLTGLWERSHKYTFGTPPIADKIVAETYPVLLRKAGYRTGFVGKFGVNAGQGGTGKMFDSFVPLNRNPYWKKLPDGSRRHLTDLTGDKAIEFVQSCSKDKPFCLSVSFNAAHAEDSDKKDHFPWPDAEDGLYEDITIPPPWVRTDFWKELPEFFHTAMHRDRWFWRWDTEEKYQKNVKAYYRMLTGLDRNIGRVLEEVNKRGFGDNTVVIFMGDNGYYKGSRGFAGKWSHFEESLRVPLVMYDPRVAAVNGGRVVDVMTLNVDVPATITKLATGQVPASYQGFDMSLWCNAEVSARWRSDFFCEHLMERFDIPKWEGVRGQRYVYARYFENLPEGEFLHDLEKDPKQLKNFVKDAAYADVLAEMRKRCDQLRDQYGGEYSLQNFPNVRRQQKRTPKKKKAG
ncbi:MAG: mucin-desulfating sulfatase [Planctomycetaceae bacterium]|nr:mucin-desulfating sulfatase [Planctomycetaceae bacterium]